jgi:hypothetical protein
VPSTGQSRSFSGGWGWEKDLLDPDVLGAAVAQPLEVPRGVREPVGMVDAQPVDGAVADQLERERVRLGEDLRVLLAHAGEVVDVEEAPVAAGLGVDVEELRAQLRIGPVAVALVRGHVVGDDVEHDPQPRLAHRGDQRFELLPAAELLRDAARVDDVVAVRGARARLERRRQVQVADAEVAQVGDQLARLREAHAGAELQPVGRAQLRHVSPSCAAARASATSP